MQRIDGSEMGEDFDEEDKIVLLSEFQESSKALGLFLGRPCDIFLLYLKFFPLQKGRGVKS